MGSIGAAAWIAKLTLLALLIKAWLSCELGLRALVLFATLGGAVWILLPWLHGGAGWVTTALAAVDIALVFAVFKGDVRIS